jgi:hypothetical protein
MKMLKQGEDRMNEEIKIIDEEIKLLQQKKKELLNNSKDHLTLKWGTLKSWDFHTDKAKKLLEEYSKIGFTSGGRMMQEDTPLQKEIICQLIDEGDFKTVLLDWDNKRISKTKAKKYVMEYGQK